ncbi:hypothetical protein [Paracoccus laeviglucosivorans]|uniref:Uncharacterized protein n=1 Tax=Paracoccus laeviglucosivorans TaxID=1197861 RepID=A0A521FN75_9RHOB|nr:hypothetical protein [Paracoccus laeviglucosivorans]SMO97612.1 hypothetical protein SAMN06265221_12836 [Paracoccus laeviglucosivorans]
MRTVALTDALTGITDIFHNPPWHLESLLAYKHWCIVRLVNSDGVRLMIPTTARRVTLDERFALWVPIVSPLTMGSIESLGQGRAEEVEIAPPLVPGLNEEPQPYPVRFLRRNTHDES